MNKKIVTIAVSVLLVLGIGYFVPISSYTTTKGCPTEITPTERLSLIFGDSLNDIKEGDVEPPPNVGCSQNTKYELYLF